MFNLSISFKKSFTYIEPGTRRNENKVWPARVVSTIFVLVKSVKDIFKAFSSCPLIAKPLHLHEGHCCVWWGQAPAWSAAKTSTGASCRYWKRKIGNQKASGQWSRGPKKAFLFVRINANLISFSISMSIFNTFEIFRMFLTNLNVKYCKQYPIFRKLDMYRSTNFSFPKKFHLSSSPNPGQILMSYLFLNYFYLREIEARLFSEFFLSLIFGWDLNLELHFTSALKASDGGILLVAFA